MNWDYYLASPDHRYHDLDYVRANYPIIWSLCVGHRTSRAIASSLGWPQDIALAELRRHKKLGHVHDEQGASSIVWKLDDEEWADLAHWVRAAKRVEKRAARDIDGDEAPA